MTLFSSSDQRGKVEKKKPLKIVDHLVCDRHLFIYNKDCIYLPCVDSGYAFIAQNGPYSMETRFVFSFGTFFTWKKHQTIWRNKQTNLLGFSSYTLHLATAFIVWVTLTKISKCGDWKNWTWPEKS